MNQDTVDSIKATIGTIGNSLDSVLGAADPALHVPIIIGTAVAQQAPALVKDVEDWLANIKSGKAPTDEQNQVIAAKIAALLQPEGPGLA